MLATRQESCFDRHACSRGCSDTEDRRSASKTSIGPGCSTSSTSSNQFRSHIPTSTNHRPGSVPWPPGSEWFSELPTDVVLRVHGIVFQIVTFGLKAYSPTWAYSRPSRCSARVACCGVWPPLLPATPSQGRTCQQNCLFTYTMEPEP